MRFEHKSILSGGRTAEARGVGAQGAFTLVDLVVCVAMLGVLALVLQPVLAGTRTKAAVCMNNMRQLAAAWTLYATENDGRLAINNDMSQAYGGIPNWVSGVMNWTTATANTNQALLIDNRYSLLGNYCGADPRLFACPAEDYLSPAQRALKWKRRARSVAMNGGVGEGNKFNFGWPAWYVARRMTDFISPAPDRVWVLMDEHPDSVDDAIFYVNRSSTNGTGLLPELPGGSHDGAGTATFADGHVVMHLWQTAAVRPGVVYLASRLTLYGNADLAWLAAGVPGPP